MGLPLKFRLAFLFLPLLAFGGCGAGAVLDTFTTGSIPASKEASAPGYVYLFRGIGGRIASLDLDYLAEKIKSSGISAQVHNFTDWHDPAEQAIKGYRADPNPKPIILVGHSAGADATLAFSHRLKKEGIPVNLVIAFDPTRRAPLIPANIDRIINVYGSMNFFGGGNIRPEEEFQGHFSVVDLKQYWDVLHVNMVKIPGLQERVLAKIVQVTTLPTNLEGLTAPIRYVMMRDKPIELFDSGLPVKAEAGDTLRTLAQRYGAPLWAVSQVNSGGLNTPLKPGQRVVIPRHLDPMSVSSPPPLTSFAAPNQ